MAPDQTQARRYLEILRGWVPPAQAMSMALAVSNERGAQETLAAFRLMPEPSVLVTVAMAYEGLDAPEVAVVAALTHVRSRPWLEQMVARATRVDPQAGPYAAQRALVFHPDDPLFARFRWRMEREQGAAPQGPAAAPPAGARPAGLAGGRDRRDAPAPGHRPAREQCTDPAAHHPAAGPRSGGGAGGGARAGAAGDFLTPPGRSGSCGTG
ncbi:hypothetical protein ACFQY5_37660 [Paeniroseomonas aquatica]|uniref:hypothetical protein n=1 Tax=Paeniroseomonas aquatica TaxID=373043 RepID=UPI003622FD28